MNNKNVKISIDKTYKIYYPKYKGDYKYERN